MTGFPGDPFNQTTLALECLTRRSFPARFSKI